MLKKFVGVIALFAAVSLRAGILYVTPEGGGDGTSWDSAITLSAALAGLSQEGTDAVELRLKSGVHYLSAKTTVKQPLTIRGGYDGSEGEASTPTLDKYATVISGDTAKNNVWAHVDPVTGAKELALDGDGAVIPVIKDGALNLPPAYTGKYDVYYPAVSNNGAVNETTGDVSGFITSSGAATSGVSIEILLENITLSGFTGNIVQLGSDSNHKTTVRATNMAVVGSSATTCFYSTNWGDWTVGNGVDAKFNKFATSFFYEDCAINPNTWSATKLESIYSGERSSDKSWGLGMACRRKGLQIDGCSFAPVHEDDGQAGLGGACRRNQLHVQ